MSNIMEFNFTDPGYSAPEEPVFDFGASGVTVISILAGSSLDFNSIWADPSANINTGRFYVASRGVGAAFSVVDSSPQVLVDSYTLTKPGEYDEYLDSEDIVDINVNMAGA